MQGCEAQVFELDLDLLHAQPVGQGGVDVEGLLGGPGLFPVGHGRDGAQVVHPVGELDDQDPDVLGHRHQHLAHGAGLLGLLGIELDPLQFGDTVDDGRQVLAELPRQVFEGDAGVFHRVVEQGGCDGDFVEAQFGHDSGHRHRVGDVGLARLAALALVGLGGHLVGAGDVADLVARFPSAEAGDQWLELIVGEDLLAAPREHPVDGGHQAPTPGRATCTGTSRPARPSRAARSAMTRPRAGSGVS